jgi:hypothetical protein
LVLLLTTGMIAVYMSAESRTASSVPACLKTAGFRPGLCVKYDDKGGCRLFPLPTVCVPLPRHTLVRTQFHVAVLLVQALNKGKGKLRKFCRYLTPVGTSNLERYGDGHLCRNTSRLRGGGGCPMEITNSVSFPWIN